MIFGIGTDIIEVNRIEKLFDKYGNKFLQRLFSEEEENYSLSKKDKKNAMRSLAGRFAAKEAFVKALGTGIRKPINFKDILIFNDNKGKPFIKLKKIMPQYSENCIQKIHLSLSHSNDYAVATVILEN